MNNIFFQRLIKKVIESIPNNHKDNYDLLRFGVRKNERFSLKGFIKEKYIYPKFISRLETNYCVRKALDFLNTYGANLEFLYSILNDKESQSLLVDIMAYRILGEKIVKFNLNTKEFWTHWNESYNFADKNDYVDIKFMNWKLYNTNFSKYNLPINLYVHPPSIVLYGFLGQYDYRIHQSIKVENDDIVLDCGGCYGDTALIFGHMAGKKGKVYSFEFIPSNIEIFEKNIALNKGKVSNIEIIKNPLWEKSDLKLYYKDNGPGSVVKIEKNDDADGKVNTISIDDFVLRKSIAKIDFIKMDIEGAELFALKGAINSIIKFKPKLAISLYHSMEDFATIPQFLNNLGIGYKFYLGHYTIHTEETVLYAIAL